MTGWQVHWSSLADTGNGPLRASGYGDSAEDAYACLLRNIEGMLSQWLEEASGHNRAVDEALAVIEAA